MGDSLMIDLAGTTTEGRAIAACSDEATAAGSAFLAAAGAVPGSVPAGASIGSSLQAAGEAFGEACSEMLSSALGLGGLVQEAAVALAATEQAAIRRFGGLVAI
jgi:hypothetical protein